MPTYTLIDKVVTDIQAEKAKLTNQMEQLDAALLNLRKFSMAVRNMDGSAVVLSRKGTRLSAAARNKISRAQKARWAKIKAGKK